MPSATPDYRLTEEQKQEFLENGFIKLENCFSLDDDLCIKMMSRMWERLDMDPNDTETWNPWRVIRRFKVHLPRRLGRSIPMKDFCPKAWSAICELSGGEDRVDSATQPIPGLNNVAEDIDMAVISDAFIVNVGSKEDAAKWTAAGKQGTASVDFDGTKITPAQHALLDPHDRDNWHVDGDFFHHFLDSKEQGLLPIVIFSDIKTGGGGTVICPDAIPTMAKHLAAHPEGVMPDMSSSINRETPYEKFSSAFYSEVVAPIAKDRFRTAIGKPGDIYLLHPLMVHSAQPNYLREPRIITNPPVALRQPMDFDRPDGDYSLVEQKTLRALGHPEGLKGWKPTGERKLIVPERVKRQALMKKIEDEPLMPVPATGETVKIGA